MSELEWLDAFGDKLKYMLEELGMTQRELAEEADLAESTISSYINKQKLPGIKAIINICEALSCDFDELLWYGDTIK